jgi:hypothetical protein
MKMQVYGKYKEDHGTFGNSRIDKAKTSDFVNSIVSLNGMGFNMFAGIGNVLNGTHQMNIEAIAGQFFDKKDLLFADAQIGKHLPGVWSELGKRVKHNKLNLMMEAFNTKQDYESRIRGFDIQKRGRLERAFEAESMFLFNDAGEF